MKCKLSDNNPFKYNRYGFAWENVPDGASAHLDVGCYAGSFLDKLRNRNIARLVGVDVSKDALEKARQQFDGLELIGLDKDTSLPFADQTFDSITILDVIEHVYEQNELLDEINRVLKDGGVVIVTVPGKHLFSFLDFGNFKFIFPKLHCWFYLINHSKRDYEYRYVSNPYGLIGDISAKKRWHEHFSRKKLEELLNNSGLEVVRFDGIGFFSRFITCIGMIIGWIKPLRAFTRKLHALDDKIFESTNLFCVARRY